MNLREYFIGQILGGLGARAPSINFRTKEAAAFAIELADETLKLLEQTTHGSPAVSYTEIDLFADECDSSVE